MKEISPDKKKAKGTYRQGRSKTAPVDFELVDDLTPPEELVNAMAIKEWTLLAPKLHSKNLLTFPDRKLLAAYCIEVAKYFDSVNAIDKLGSIIPLKDGQGKIVNYMKNPHYDLADKALKNALNIGAHFGLTPASRGKLTVAEKKSASPEEEASNKLGLLRAKASQGKVVQMKKTA